MNFDLPKEHQLRYLNRRSADIEDLKTCLDNENFETAVTIGHRLKGSGQTFGFPLISTLGSTIEEAGLVRDRVRVQEAVDQLAFCVQNYLAQIQA